MDLEWVRELSKKVSANKGFCAKFESATDKTGILSQTIVLKMILEDRLKDLEKCLKEIEHLHKRDQK